MFSFGGKSPVLTIVVPCYNEEEVLSETVSRLTRIVQSMINESIISLKSSILLVDDGSKDGTWLIIESLNRNNTFVKGLKLARNVGHQNALLAGLHTSSQHSDCVVSIDADLQDDVQAIVEFVKKFHEGYEVVYGVRQSRATDTFAKRNTALGFYKVMEKMGVNIVYNHADFRLLSHRALMHLKDFKEVNMFLRGIVPLIGFKSTNVYYDRNERFAGESKYPLKKMIAFAIDGITSFSVTPIRLVTTIGFVLFIISILASIYALVSKAFGQVVTGWTSLIISIWLIGGLQLIGIGMLGEYIGKIYMEVKGRPKYIVEIDHFSMKDSEHNMAVLGTREYR